MPEELGQRSMLEADDGGDIFLLAARKRRSVIEVTLCCWKHTGSCPCGHTLTTASGRPAAAFLPPRGEAVCGGRRCSMHRLVRARPPMHVSAFEQPGKVAC